MQLRVKLNLIFQRFQIGRNIIVSNDRIEITVDAFVIAERDVNVNSGFFQDLTS